MKTVTWSIGVIVAAAMVLVAGRVQAQGGTRPSDEAVTTSSATSATSATSNSGGPGAPSTATPTPMGAGPSATGANGHFGTLKGRIQTFDRSNNTLTLSGSDKMLKVDPSTQVMKDGSRASIDDIKEGEQVRASFSESGDTPHVQTLDIVGNGAGGSYGAASGPSVGYGPSTGTGATASGSMSGSEGITTDLTTGSGTGTGAQSNPPSSGGSGK